MTLRSTWNLLNSLYIIFPLMLLLLKLLTHRSNYSHKQVNSLDILHITAQLFNTVLDDINNSFYTQQKIQ